jgi:hypothetical protein
MKNQPNDAQNEIEDVSDDEIRDFLEVEMHEAERQDRLWLRSCTIFVESLCKANKADMDGRTLTAINEAVVAACDRASRIFHGDSRSIEDEPECGHA